MSYAIKTGQNGSPKFNVLLLQEPENTSAERLHVARKQAITNAKCMFPRRSNGGC